MLSKSNRILNESMSISTSLFNLAARIRMPLTIILPSSSTQSDSATRLASRLSSMFDC